MWRRFVVALLGIAGSVALMGSGGAWGAETPDPELVRQVKEAVIQELRDSGVIAQEVDAGIRRVIEREQARRQAAQRQQEAGAAQRAKDIRPPAAARDHIRGNPEAEVSIIEYSDFECPFCKRFHSTAMKLVEAFDGRVNWVYRHFPLAFHNPKAQREAEASECAAELGGNDAFWQLSDGIYERTPSNGKGLEDSQLAGMAAAIGVDRQAFTECLNSGRHAARVAEDFREGTAIGVTGTPGNFLRNNKTGDVLARPGARPFEAMKADIEFLLN